MTSVWTADDVGKIDLARTNMVPVIDRIEHQGLDPDRIYWDMWPIQDRHGHVATIAHRQLWMALCAPDRGNPDLRHFEAKIHLLEHALGGWHDLGPVLPNRDVPYEREWAGSAITDGMHISLYFTAAGSAYRPGGYQQQLFESHASIRHDGMPTDWTEPKASITRYHPDYMLADAHEGDAGKIKAFRDPSYFRDPADGAEYLIFTASLANATSAYNGAVGIARKHDDGWHLLAPLIHADHVNNELERAHIVFNNGHYYAFWATQSSTFSPDLRHAPNGLYGMVADHLFGPYNPVNDSGLILCNPTEEPMQCYSWFVNGDLQVASFVDFWGLKGRPVPADPVQARRHFGGVPAPLLQLSITGNRCVLVQSVLA